MSRHHKPRLEVWVVIRDDHFHRPDIAMSDRITVKAIYNSREHALAEVERLNALRPHEKPRYFCTMGRYFADAVAPAEGSEV